MGIRLVALSRFRPEGLSQRQGQWVIGASREEREYARCVMGGRTQLVGGTWTSCPARSYSRNEGTVPRWC